MAERKSGAGRTKRPDHAIAAGTANLAKGRAKKAAQHQAAKDSGAPRAKDRWAMLLDGRLTVADLDDEEIRKMRVRGADGGFAGRRPAIPSHIAQQMQAEAIKRAQEKFRNAAPRAVDALIELANDPDIKPGDRIRALSLVLERSLGKVPDTVRVEAADAWGKLMRDASPEQFAREAIEDD